VRFASDSAVLAEQIAKAGPSPEVVVEATYILGGRCAR
jgi:hypothetical protein